MEFTDKQIEEYVDNPDYCPFCNSKDIRVIEKVWDLGSAFRRVKCYDCKWTWYEEYNLTTISNPEKSE